jgi:scyllo-inositol 2-dehydrogenase (NADP+)
MTKPRPSGDLRVGLIGYSLGGAIFHAPLIAATPGLTLAAIVTSNEERRVQAKTDFPDADVVPSADALFDRAETLDLVVISTPNKTHVPLAIQAMAAGLAVVVDKPFAVTAEAGRSAIAEARRRGVMLTVYHNRRFDGDFLTIRRLITDGSLGDVTRFESQLERWRPIPKIGWRESGSADEAGGTLYDLGSHLIDQALVLFGPVASVYAELDRRRPGVQVEDEAFVALTHVNGVRSRLWTGAVAAQLGPRFRVLGTRAGYLKYGTDPQEALLRNGERPSGPEWGVEQSDAWGLLGTGESAQKIPTEHGGYQMFYEAVVAAMRDGAAPPVDPMDAVAGLEIIEAARRSSATGSVVRPASSSGDPRRV